MSGTTVSGLDHLQERLSYEFKDAGLLRLALTHPSVAHEQGSSTQHNQRLEFLGDSVLQLVLTRVLYERYPEFGEGPLTKARAHLVNRRSLADQARRLQLGECLIMSRGEEMSQGRERQSALADAFEALMGAIFLDGGFAAAEQFILKQFLDGFGGVAGIPNLDNPKGELQELLQAQSSESPRYQLASVSGPDHDRLFESAVFHRGVELGRGTGKSKKAAESEAAWNALQQLRLRSTTDSATSNPSQPDQPPD